MSEADARPTLVGRLLGSGPAIALMSLLPVPLWLVRVVLTRDNAKESGRDNWNRLRDEAEASRYATVREVTERYAHDGFVLDVGCSQGILQEGLAYGRYLGVDFHAPSITAAAAKADQRTSFVVGDGASFVPPARPDAVVLNEMIYYLADPVGAVHHHADQLARDGVVIVSIFAHTWSSRRLLARLARELALVESRLVQSGHLAWTVAVYRPRARVRPG